MGLDITAFFVDKNAIIDEFSFRNDEPSCGGFEWQSHWALKDYFQEMYANRGGDLDVLEKYGRFTLRLHSQDIDNLQRKINEYVVEKKPIFESDDIIIFKKRPTLSLYKSFIGREKTSAEDDEEILRRKNRDLAFIREAKEALAEHKAIYFEADW